MPTKRIPQLRYRVVSKSNRAPGKYHENYYIVRVSPPTGMGGTAKDFGPFDTKTEASAWIRKAKS